MLIIFRLFKEIIPFFESAGHREETTIFTTDLTTSENVKAGDETKEWIMNPIIRVMRKNLFIVVINTSIFLLAGNAYGASEFLLQNAANKKYTYFSSCLKSSDNLFTLCIDELKEYISAENKYIKVKKLMKVKTDCEKLLNILRKVPISIFRKPKKQTMLVTMIRRQLLRRY